MVLLGKRPRVSEGSWTGKAGVGDHKVKMTRLLTAPRPLGTGRRQAAPSGRCGRGRVPARSQNTGCSVVRRGTCGLKLKRSGECRTTSLPHPQEETVELNHRGLPCIPCQLTALAPVHPGLQAEPSSSPDCSAPAWGQCLLQTALRVTPGPQEEPRATGTQAHSTAPRAVRHPRHLLCCKT